MEKSWVWLPRNSLEYEKGATEFVSFSSRRLGDPAEMFFPCVDCRNVCHQSSEKFFEHLVIRGMDLKYKSSKFCNKHGETRPDKSADVYWSENGAYDLFRTTFLASEGNEANAQDNAGVFEGTDTPEEAEFRKKLEDGDCLRFTKVATIMGLYRIKVKSWMSENYFDQLLALVHDLLPGENFLPKSTYEMKKFLKQFGFGYDVIHGCKKDCILYRKEFEDAVSCPRCSEPRWEKDNQTGEEKKGIPAKVVWYFSIKDRFRRMFISKWLADDLCWHSSNTSEDGNMRHHVDSLTWVQINNKWPEFVAEARNLRLGISKDGMDPFSIQNTKHSTWHVLLVNYNMAPTPCMRSENIMLTILIPGPTPP